MKRRLSSSILLVPLLAAAAPALARTGYGPWTLGMSRQQVTAQAEFGPYQPVASTGGLETRNARFLEQTVTTSFVFDSSGLYLIQIWAYEGQSYPAAIKAFHGVYDYLCETYGPLLGDQGPIRTGLSEQELEALQPEGFETKGAQPELPVESGSVGVQTLRFHLHPKDGPSDQRVFASFLHTPKLGLYYVFLYFRAPDAE